MTHRRSLAYRGVVDSGTFDSPAGLRTLLEGMIDRHMRTSVDIDEVIRLRPDLTVAAEGTEVVFRARRVRVMLGGHADPAGLAALLRAGDLSAGEIALRRERDAGVDMAETFLMLDGLFGKGLLDEEPRPPAASPAEQGSP
jgi:hypothetical protein